MNHDTNQLLYLVCNIALNAGNKILKYFNTDYKIIKKKDNSPLTSADLESNKVIINELSKIYTNVPILSEESIIDWSSRKKWNKFWLVDPLDGTKEFINKSAEFTVNIALIENNKPILGVIYAPALSKIYYAAKNFGSFKLIVDKRLDNLEESISIKAQNKNPKDDLIIVKSRSHSYLKDEFDLWLKQFSNYSFKIRGSSLKFCDIAEGSADLYPRFGPTSEWDIAAGDIIVSEAGGNLKNLKEEDIYYNKESIINPNFVASCRLSN